MFFFFSFYLSVNVIEDGLLSGSRIYRLTISYVQAYGSCFWLKKSQLSSVHFARCFASG